CETSLPLAPVRSLAVRSNGACGLRFGSTHSSFGCPSPDRYLREEHAFGSFRAALVERYHPPPRATVAEFPCRGQPAGAGPNRRRYTGSSIVASRPAPEGNGPCPPTSA